MPEESASNLTFSDDAELTVSETADERGLHVATIRAWINQDMIPARRDGRRWLIRRDDVERFLQENPNLGKPRVGRHRRSEVVPEPPRPPEREGTRRYGTGILTRGLPL